MATSESDDFESADEEIEVRRAPSNRVSCPRIPSTVDSESDDDGDSMQQVGAPFVGSWSTGGKSKNAQPSEASSKMRDADAKTVDSKSDALGSDRTERTKANSEPESKKSHDKPSVVPGIVAQSLEHSGTGSAGRATVLPNEAVSETSSHSPENLRETIDDKETKANSEPKSIKSHDKPSVVPGIVAKSLEDSGTGSTGQETVLPNEAVSGTSSHSPENLRETIDDKETLISRVTSSESVDPKKSDSEPARTRRERSHKQVKPREPRQHGAKKLGSKIASEPIVRPPPIATSPDEIRKKALEEGRKPPLIEQCWEGIDAPETGEPIPEKLTTPPKWDSSWDNPVKPSNVEPCWEDIDGGLEMPEELKSNKKFKEVFQFDGWEGAEDDVEIPDELTEQTILPVLDKLSSVGQMQADKSGGWGWGGWGVSSLLNTATAGVSTLTSHVSHGLTMLEETIGAPDPEELAMAEAREGSEATEEKKEEVQKVQSQPSFGFGNLMSGVSSITNFVESTSTRVISGGLDTLETIGKKTMEVLQDGDPGLKKKRAFFLHESDKPILSQMLREAKENAEVEEKTLEERQLARKVHFESLFDDYQGLVHLEALEMLSKQCNMRIQQKMIDLDEEELASLQETLEEVKELCDLGDEDDEEENDKDLKERLKDACKDLGVNITYDKLLDSWEEVRSYLSKVESTESVHSDREVFQRAIATLAQFTAFSVERFHKTAELLLIKERRSTVNEADSLVQLAQILSGQIGVVANSFSGKLNDMSKNSEKPEVVSSNITNIFLEAANASSYVLEAFKLLIPVLQVGAT